MKVTGYWNKTSQKLIQMFDRYSIVNGLLCRQVKNKGLLIHQLPLPVCLRSLVLLFLHAKNGHPRY